MLRDVLEKKALGRRTRGAAHRSKRRQPLRRRQRHARRRASPKPTKKNGTAFEEETIAATALRVGADVSPPPRTAAMRMSQHTSEHMSSYVFVRVPTSTRLNPGQRDTRGCAVP